MAVALGIRVGGSGHMSKGQIQSLFKEGKIPLQLDGVDLCKKGTLNIVLEKGIVFNTPTKETSDMDYEQDDEIYYLNSIRLAVINASSRKRISSLFPGFILRKKSHPQEFDNIIEIIATDCTEFLQPSLKEWFELNGPFSVCKTDYS